MMRGCAAWPWFLFLCACGSVAAPQQQRYRLEWPHPEPAPAPRLGVLRVLDLQAASHLQGEGIVVADGAVRLRQSELQLWAAPLERLVTEALTEGLSRSRVFTLVKGAGDAGGEDLILDGRLLAFEQDATRKQAHVLLELWLERAGTQVLRTELRAEAPCPDPAPEAIARGLSSALNDAVGQLLAELRGVPAGAAEAVPIR
jgi:uncharacterized lipoprotein YmbA